MKFVKDKKLKKLIQTLEAETAPPRGLKEKILAEVTALKYSVEPVLTPVERFIFEKPLRAASLISVFVSGVLWAVTGSDFVRFFSSIIG